MAKSSASFSNSLRAKIWLSTVTLAFFACTFGALSYVVISFLINDPFYAIFIPFLLLAMTIAAFGLWLSNEVVNPVEKVALLAKSLERGISASLPKTSGARETDELLETINRISGQTQRLVTSMDSVAQGDLSGVNTQNPSSDRISQSFQKLLAKVSESIHAKQELEKLEFAVRQIVEDAAAVKNNNLNGSVESDHQATQEIAEIINHLTEQLGALAAHVKSSAAKSQTLTAETQRTLQNTLRQEESRVQEINQAATTLQKVPQLIHKISDEISQSAQSARQSVEKAQQGAQNAQAQFNSVSQLRKQIQEAASRIEKLNECTQEVDTAAKAVGDLAQRTNLVALNTSLQAAELGEQGRGFVVASEEIERLAARAEQTNKQIGALNKAIQTEIEKVAKSLETVGGEVANFSKFVIETGNLSGEMERYLIRYLNVQEKIDVHAGEQTVDIERAFQSLNQAIAQTDHFAGDLKESAQTVGGVARSMGNLQSAVAHFSLATYTAAAKIRQAETTETRETTDITPVNFEGETLL